MILDILVIVYLGYPALLLMVYTFVSIVRYINHVPGMPTGILIVGLVIPQIAIGMALVFIGEMLIGKIKYIKRRMQQKAIDTL